MLQIQFLFVRMALIIVVQHPAIITHHSFIPETLVSPKNALNTIFVCENDFDHCGTATSNNCPSFFHTRNFGMGASIACISWRNY